ncbi:MAG: alginate O-acetyltransferase [Planctomycetota bacterium]|nr:MAG: alginate O-acetyltransferase [Planctomycetota bacterium]
MNFVEARFPFFFLAVFLLHWALRGERSRKRLLLVASYTFYGAWDARFLALIVFSTLVDYAAGLGIADARSTRKRRAWLALSLCVNLGVLGAFKYADFFIESARALAQRLGLEAYGLAPGSGTLDWLLPVGISFYTFQTLSYSIDVYRGKLRATRNLLDLALFVGFFPQLVAGPIVRAADFLPQLRTPRRFGNVAVRAALWLFLIGYFKKACVADNAARVVDAVFAAPEQFTLASRALGAALYAVQIYGDFSGYSDMAIACAALLGYALPENFRAPYLATSITDFWRRWHISLSTWFRDYLYIPLGGNRAGRGRTARNLLIVFLLCGLWHGAKWTFVIWGLWHGLFLILERSGAGRLLHVLPSPARRLYALLVVLLGWVLFRADDLSSAWSLLSQPGGEQTVAAASAWSLVIVVLFLAQLGAAGGALQARLDRLRNERFALCYGFAVALVLSLISLDHQAFIYFVF